MLLRAASPLLLFLFSLLAGPLPVAAQVDAAKASFPTLKANQLVGMTVENKDGHELGKVRNLAVDANSGAIKYVIVANGGFFGIRTQFRAVPPEALSAATAKRNVLAISLSKEQWRRAPTFKLSKARTLADPNREKQIARFYKSAASPTFAQNAAHDSPRLAPTGKPVASSGQLKLATDFFGETIFNVEGEKLGEILDLLVSLEPDSPVLAIFSAGKLSRDHSHAYLVPLRDLTTARKKLTLEVKRQKLDQAVPFTQRAWAAINQKPEPPQIFSYALAN